MILLSRPMDNMQQINHGIMVGGALVDESLLVFLFFSSCVYVMLSFLGTGSSGFKIPMTGLRIVLGNQTHFVEQRKSSLRRSMYYGWT